MTIFIFYSWQSELQNITDHIRNVLKDCCEKLAVAYSINIEVVEASTKNRGSYNINDAVINGITNADILVADLTPTNQGAKGRALPNANAIFEYAFACGLNGFEKVLAVADVSTHNVKNMPFDWNHNSIVCFNGLADVSFTVNLYNELEKIIKPFILPVLREATTTFVSRRIGMAFPKERGLKIFDDPHDIRKHLEMFFKHPIIFGEATDPEGDREPLWWFRGGGSEGIDYFEISNNGVFRMGWNEMRIKRIAVYANPHHYYAEYIYIETEPLPPLTVNYTKDDIKRIVDDIGYCEEEYAVLKQGELEVNISRLEYDNGYADINGKIIPIHGKAHLRCRFLSPFNFVVCAKFSSINSNRFDLESHEIMDGILKGTSTIDDLHKLIVSLPKPPYRGH